MAARRPAHSLSFLLLVLFVMVRGPVPAAAQSGPDAGEGTAPLYDESADGQVLIQRALERAARENKRVLIQWGANWCGWCRSLHELMSSDGEIARKILYEYEVVLIDVGHFDKHLDLAGRYRARFRDYGVPYLTLLAADGTVLANQETSSLETEGDSMGHDREKVLALLERHQAPYRDARQILSEALKEAEIQNKKVFLHSGAPWCGWCRRLEEWMLRDEIASIMGKYFVDVKIDVDRTVGGKEVMDGYNGGYGGVPWLAMLEPDGTVIIDSVAPNGRNIGSPQAMWEIGHFRTMLATAAPEMTGAEIEILTVSLAEDRP